MEVEKWKRHFQRMAEGKVRPNHKGHYIVEEIQVGSGSREPEINFVTPVAQDIELAKSELKANKGQLPTRTERGYKRTQTVTRKAKKKPRFSDNVFTD